MSAVDDAFLRVEKTKHLLLVGVSLAS